MSQLLPHPVSIIAIKFTMLFTGLSREILSDYEPKSTNWRSCTKGSKQEEKNEVALSRHGFMPNKIEIRTKRMACIKKNSSGDLFHSLSITVKLLRICQCLNVRLLFRRIK